MIKSWKTSGGVVIYRLLGLRSNVFLVSNDNFTLLVDSGIRPERSLLVKRLSRFAGHHKPDMLLLTHTHFDHAANAAFLKQRFGCAIAVHAYEADFLSAGSSPLPKGQAGFTKFLNKLDKRKIEFLFRTAPAEPDMIITDSMDLSGSNIPVKIIHTPGHTAGSVSVIVDGEIAIVGDEMINMFLQRVFPPFCDDVPALLDSWQKLLDTGCSLFLPSHGKEITRKQLSESLDRKRLSQADIVT